MVTISFLAFYMIMLSLVAQATGMAYFDENNIDVQDPRKFYDTNGDYNSSTTITVWDNIYGNDDGYNVSLNLTGRTLATADNLWFDGVGAPDIGVKVIHDYIGNGVDAVGTFLNPDPWERNLFANLAEHSDAVIVWQELGMIGGQKKAAVYDMNSIFIKYSEYMNENDTSNFVFFKFTLLSYGTLVIEVDSFDNWIFDLTNCDFRVYIGTSFEDQITTLQAQTSALGIIGMMLTWSLPGLPWEIHAILNIPIYAAIGFMSVTILSRFIPTIPGG